MKRDITVLGFKLLEIDDKDGLTITSQGKEVFRFGGEKADLLTSAAVLVSTIQKQLESAKAKGILEPETISTIIESCQKWQQEKELQDAGTKGNDQASVR